MKKLFYLVYTLFLLTISFYSVAQDQFIVRKGERPPIDLNTVPDDAYYPNRVLIKLKAETEAAITAQPHMSISDGEIIFGLPALDKLHHQINVTATQQFFYSAALANTFTEKHKAWGFHLWYELRYDSHLTIKEVINRYKNLPEIEIVEPIYKKRRIESVGRSEAFEPKTINPLDVNWVPNDPRFNEQWHYHNTGQQNGTPDADIDLPEAWELEKGNKDVIVAVIDGGIQINHPDLIENLWDGIGYNFVNNNANILPDNHGTHVAGTIAAVNNNTIGVSGIAGGSGNNDGVSLMSCQVFTDNYQGGFHIAPIWAADHGASISQNSWGYEYEGQYNQAVLDAIDYFNLNGGGDAMDGGITIFAAGNDGLSGQWYPGCYSGAFAIAATNNQDKKAWYSNYDTWVDISAPGGETNTVAARGVLSTLRNSTYGFYQGTSMACPHVSGVAALVISHVYGVLTADELREILTTTTDNHYAVNPGYIGKLGSGRLNAHAALLASEYFLSGVLNPKSFSAMALDANTIQLDWQKNANNDQVIILWSANGTFGDLQNGTNYTVGQAINGGGTVLYKGTLTSFQHSNLLPNTSYYYKAFSFDNTNTYSTGRTANARTELGVINPPYFEDFEAEFPPLGWTIYDVDGAPDVRTWVASTAQNHTPGGNRSAFHNYGPSSQTEDGWLVTPKLALPANSEIELNFWNYNTFPGWYYKNSVLVSTGDGTPQTGNFVELWSPASVTASWVQTSIDLSAYAGQEAYIAFRYQGSNAHAWHLDDVSITAEQFIPALTVTPPNQNVTAPAGLTSFTVTSNTAWDVGSDQGWCAATPSGDGNGTITVNFTENTSINIRIATLTVTAAGVDPVLVTVTQAGRVPEPIADVILRPQQMDISDASSRSAVLVKLSDYPTDDIRYRLYNGANQYNCWDGTQYVLSNSYALSPLVPGDPTNEIIWWIMFERGNNASVSANYRDRLGPTYAVNHLTISLPDTDPIVNSFTISETLPLNAVYPLNESYVVLGFDSQIGGNLISATASDLTTGEFELIVSTATVIRRLEVRNQLNVLIEEVTGAWEAQNDPQVFDFSGGGTYCEVNLPSGVQALLSGSEVGVDYQLLKDGNPFGEIEPGTGNPIVWYDLEAGSYTVEADNGAITILMNGTVSVTADEALPVSVSIVADQMSVCQGQTVTFTAVPENEGDNPAYQWLVNTIPAGNNHAVFSYIPEAGDQVQLIMTSSLNCVTNSPAWSNSIAAEVLPMVNASVSFTADQNNVCQGTEVEFVAVAIHGGQAPVYQWYVNGTQSGQNSAIFSYIPSNGDLVELSMTSSETCVAVNPVTADPITMNVTPLAVVSVSVNADANPVCSGSGVTLTALPTHPGSMPVYQWFVNDQPVGANSATYTYIPLDNDKVQVELTSNQACATDNPAYSEPVIIQLTEAINASVSIVADIPTPCQGQTVTFTALPENGGADPSFQWFVNNNPAGINSPVFSYDPLDGDLIGLSMTSSLGCVTVNPVYDELPPLIVTPVIVELMASPASAGMVSMSGEAHIGQTVQLTATALDGWGFINWTDSDNQVVSETAVFDLILTACSQSYIAHFGSQTNISGKLVFFNDSETEVVSPYSNGSFMVQLFDEDIPLSPPQQVKQDEPFVFHGLEEQKQYSLRFWDQSNNNLLHSTWGWNNWGSVTAIDALLISHMTTGNPIILNFPWITTTTVDKLSPFAFQLADVNSSHSLSSVDMLLVMFRSVGRPDVAPFPGGKPNFLPFVHPVANLNNLTYPENPTIDFQQFGTYASTSAANSVYHMAELPSLNQGTNYFKLYLVPVGDLNASFMAQSGNKSQTMLLADQQLSLTDAYPKTIPVIINSYAEVGAFNLNLKYDPTQLHIKQLHDYEVYYDQPELGLLSVAFLNEQGKTFWPGDTLMLIDVEVNKALDLSELPFSLTGENIWADVNVQEIDEIVLTMPVLKSESVLIANAKEPQLMIYPNPFVQQTIMRVTVPETATIHLKIYNNLGKMVAVKQWEQSGSKNIEIHGDILPGSGVYSFEAIITSAEKTWLKTNKIIYLGH